MGTTTEGGGTARSEAPAGARPARPAARRRRLVVLAGTVVVLLLAATPSLSPQNRCAPTSPDAEGPFYTPDAPQRTSTGKGFVVAGTVRSAASCAPLAGARIEWWSADGRGRYDDAHRASGTAGAAGRYRYETDPPGRYPGRPPHVHVRVTAPGHQPLVTQLYPTAGQAALEVDFVLVPE